MFSVVDLAGRKRVLVTLIVRVWGGFLLRDLTVGLSRRVPVHEYALFGWQLVTRRHPTHGGPRIVDTHFTVYPHLVMVSGSHSRRLQTPPHAYVTPIRGLHGGSPVQYPPVGQAQHQRRGYCQQEYAEFVVPHALQSNTLVLYLGLHVGGVVVAVVVVRWWWWCCGGGAVVVIVLYLCLVYM